MAVAVIHIAGEAYSRTKQGGTVIKQRQRASQKSPSLKTLVRIETVQRSSNE
jgi:hypothetical protein